MNEQDIVNKLKSDPRALKSVMQSQDGQALLNMLSGGNSAALGQAARQAASGDTAALSAMLSRVLSSPQGAELVQRLETSFNSNGKEDTAWTTSMKNLTRCCPTPAVWRRSCSWRSSSPDPWVARTHRHLLRHLLRRSHHLRHCRPLIPRSSPNTCPCCMS